MTLRYVVLLVAAQAVASLFGYGAGLLHSAWERRARTAPHGENR